MGGSNSIFVLTGAALLTGSVWFLLTGSLIQFVPIGLAIWCGFKVAKAVNSK